MPPFADGGIDKHPTLAALEVRYHPLCQDGGMEILLHSPIRSAMPSLISPKDSLYFADSFSQTPLSHISKRFIIPTKTISLLRSACSRNWGGIRMRPWSSMAHSMAPE